MNERVSCYFRRDLPSSVTFFKNENIDDVILELEYKVVMGIYNSIVSYPGYSEASFFLHRIPIIPMEIEENHLVIDKAIIYSIELDFYDLTENQMLKIFGKKLRCCPKECSYVIYKNVPETRFLKEDTNSILQNCPHYSTFSTMRSFTIERIEQTILVCCIFKKSLTFYFF